jgi:hypothetical protein
MIFPTTFIFTLFLNLVGQAMAQPAQPEVGHDPVSRRRRPDSSVLVQTQTVQYKAVYNSIYDNPSQTLDIVACSNLVKEYPVLGDVPGFPFVGGAPNTSYGSENCGMCWAVTNLESGLSLFFTSIDDTTATDPSLINLSLEAFEMLDGSILAGSFEASLEMVDNSFCEDY